MLGTADEPIDLADSYGDTGVRQISESLVAKRRSMYNGSYSLVPSQGATECQRSILLDDDEKTDPFDGEGRSTALARSLKRHPTADDELIDLESIEDFLQRDGQILQVQDVYLRDAQPQNSRRPSKVVKIDRRNPSIVFPFKRYESIQHLGSTLLQNKTVELHDGSFLRIKDIIFNTQTKAIKVRGYRIQRARDMNGMLEKKINEVLLFLEVDLDDCRDPLDQAAVEIPLAEVVRLRNVRFTNEKFPLNRNTDPKDYTSKDAVLQGGGLTARWKYTCTYATAIDRYNNVFKERTLERLRASECLEKFSVSDSERRFRWRGKTIAGGAYQPTLEKEKVIFLPESREGSPVSTGSSSEQDDFALVHVQSIDNSSSEEEEGFQSFSLMEIDSGPNLAKRKYNELANSSSEPASSHAQEQKKRRHAEDKSVRETREGISRMSLQPVEKRGSKTATTVIDLLDSRQNSTQPSLPRTIDLTSSDLSKPPDIGSIGTNFVSLKLPVVRTPGQKLTYGDAFCGAGGSTRGAVMAGLRVCWGFDFWEQACETWRTNFPYAICYHKPAHKFVELAKRSEAQGFPDLMKVDILHLSPPCQFFSPAHTVSGVDDEMNTASLFAVQSVIEVSRARVVTLEQTFGIACPRFRFYFNALIQMFTAHDLSVRWAIVPLAQWVRVSLFNFPLPSEHSLTDHQGLPQRRNRLIIIASW
jgi:DNA (cytosine-5)-methyltransferase 1